MVDAIYKGEALVKRWGDSSNALRTVTLQLEEDAPLGRHPFYGHEGARVMIVVMPLGNDQQPVKIETPAKTKWQKLRPSAQAALRCNDKTFQSWLGVENGLDAAKVVRERCQVVSRADLDDDRMLGGVLLVELDEQFLGWLGTQRAVEQHKAHART